MGISQMVGDLNHQTMYILDLFSESIYPVVPLTYFGLLFYPEENQIMARPSPLACIECRQHHLKCDAKIPSCSRCSETGLICKYLPSRRGRNRRARDGHRQGLSGGLSVGGSHSNSINLPDLPNMSNTGKGHDAIPAVSEEPAQSHGLVSDIQIWNSDTDTRLVRLFYENFHSAHPILVPAFEYEKRRYPPFLQQVVRFIGSHYSLQISRDSLRHSTATLLLHPSDGSGQRTPSMVQALLLYSIMLCARGEIAEAQTAFSRALDIAFELGMHRREFAMYYSDSREVEAESLRRTWWELTIVEVFMAALQKKVALRCGSVPYDVGLPCEESVYANTNINMISSSPPTLASFSRRMFTEDDDDDGDTDGSHTRYSSFSYRIEAACILARVLVLNSLPETHHDHLQAVENALVSWTNLLPPSKVDVVDTYGVVDEMLFQAHTTIQYAAMLLHLPRSNLRPAVPTSNTNSNTNTETEPQPQPEAPPAPPATIICPTTPSRLSPSFTRHVHDTKATEASKQLSNLLSMRPSVQRYTPFIICGLALCGMVQLATSRIHAPDCAEHHRNRVVLVLGCLKVLRRNWAIADQAYHHVRMAAAEVFAGWAGSTRCFQPQAQPQSSTNAAAGAGAGNPSVGVKNSPPSSRRASTAGAAEWVNAGGGDAVNPEVLSPGLLSAYIDPTCSDPSFLNNIFDLDFT